MCSSDQPGFGHLLGITALGYWNVAMRVVDTMTGLLAQAANQVGLSLFTREQSALDAQGIVCGDANGFFAMCAAIRRLDHCDPRSCSVSFRRSMASSSPHHPNISVRRDVVLRFHVRRCRFHGFGEAKIDALQKLFSLCSIPHWITRVPHVWLGRSCTCLGRELLSDAPTDACEDSAAAVCRYSAQHCAALHCRQRHGHRPCELKAPCA